LALVSFWRLPLRVQDYGDPSTGYRRDDSQKGYGIKNKSKDALVWGITVNSGKETIAENEGHRESASDGDSGKPGSMRQDSRSLPISVYEQCDPW
jgi:hypothetical protein